MHALIAIISVVVVGIVAVLGVQYVFGQWAWVAYCVAGFFGLMALMAKVNAV